MKRIIVTGASSGIGKAIASKILQQEKPVELWLVARNTDNIREYLREIDYSHHIVHISQVDVRDRDQINNWKNEVESKWDSFQVLVNNAGLALGAQNFIDSDVDDWDVMIDTNVKGLLYVTHAFLPLMNNSSLGKHIINLGSTAGKVVYENGHVYCATKYAVDAISQGLRIDLLKYGVKVTSINPGMVDTNFSKVRYKGDEEKAEKVYEGYKILSPEDVAEVIYYTMQLPPHVNINDITLTCLQQANSFYKIKEDDLI